MHYFKSIMRIVRWPNLCIIFLAQLLFYHCLITPYQISFSKEIFYFLCGAAILSAGAGNVINDYYDIAIDRINKPEKVVIGNGLSIRIALVLYFILNVSALVCGFIAASQMGNSSIFVFVIVCIVLLWFYSRFWKKQFLIGNMTVSLLTAAPMILLTLTETNAYGVGFSFVLQLLFIFFSFWTCLIREIIKDCEDVEGDKLEKAKTLPIISGITAAKRFAIILAIILIIIFLLLAGGLLHNQLWILLVNILVLITMTYYLIVKIGKSIDQKDFHNASSIIKWIMLVGILSMLLVRHYIRIF